MRLTTDELHDITISPDDTNLFKMYQILKGGQYDTVTKMEQDLADEIKKENEIPRKFWENRTKMIKNVDKKV